MAASLLAKFAIGYLAVLVAPGPNMVTVATISAIRGFRGVLPFVIGIASGGGCLAFLVWSAVGALPDGPRIEVLGRAAAALILLAIARRVAHAPQALPGPSGCLPPAGAASALATLGAGFSMAATNPVTAAYCAAQFLGPLAESDLAVLAPGLVLLQALAYGTLVAVLFTQPAPRRLAARYHRQTCRASAFLLIGLALVVMGPLVRLH